MDRKQMNHFYLIIPIISRQVMLYYGQKFKTKMKILKEKICGFTEEEFDTLRIRAGSDSYPDYTEVNHFAEERWGK